MNQRTLAIALVLFSLASGSAMIVIGAVVDMALNGILIGFGVFMLVVSAASLYYASRVSVNTGGGSSSSDKPNKTESAENDVEKGATNVIDQQLLQDRMQDLYTFKILILGAGESGKSTVVKQLKLVHSAKIPQTQLVEDGNNLHQNIIDCFGAISQAAKRFGMEFKNEDDDKTVSALSRYTGPRISPELGAALKHLHSNEAFQTVYARRAEFWVLDAFSYYMHHIDRMLEPDFLPSEEDSLMARVRTTGLVVSHLESKVVKVNPDDPAFIKFTIVDVGGQRNERKKWIHCFDDVKAVLFVASLAGYNQVMYEDNAMNRMTEDLALFEEMTKKDIFANIPFFLFLNKKDLFEVMIRDTPLSAHFPEFKESKENNVHENITFIEKEFRKRLPPKKDILVQAVTSVWKRDIKSAFEEVKKYLIDKNKDAVAAEMKKIRAELKTK
jgi:GTPase SAR1 family protein